MMEKGGGPNPGQPTSRAASPASTESEDTDYETDEEGFVHVSVSGILQEDLSHLTPDQFSFIDIDSERPLITIGSQAFVGSYEDTVGTSVFFTASKSQDTQDPVFGRPASKQVELLSSTRKKLILKRVFLNKKNNTSDKDAQSSPNRTQEGS